MSEIRPSGAASAGPVIGAILCGGRSSRFGTDKALADVGGRPMAASIVEALRAGGADPVIAVGGTAGARLAIPTVPDRSPGQGPLAALATTLTWARAGLVVVTACDLPLLTASEVAALIEAAGPDRAAVATVDGMPQPALTCWPAGFGPAIVAMVERGERQWRRSLEAGPWIGVEVAAEVLVDADTPAELASILGRDPRPSDLEAPSPHRSSGDRRPPST